jgi:Tfp pilus assembly protein PilN
MRAINLAEIKIAERAQCKRQVNRLLKTIVLFIAVMLVVAVVSVKCKMSITSTAIKLKSELADVQGRCVQLKREIAESKAILNGFKWQEQLADASKRWTDILNSVLARVPFDVWIKRLESSEQNSSITVEGQAASFDAISRFASELRRDPQFSEVRISSTQVTESRGAMLVDFGLQVKLKSPPGATTSQPSTQQEAQAQSTEVPEVAKTY